MLKFSATSLSTAWVKNVYSLCVEGVVNRAQSYTADLLSTTYWLRLRVQPTRYTHSLDSFTPTIYTANFPNLTDTKTYLYTLSTAPTIKKNKKK